MRASGLLLVAGLASACASRAPASPFSSAEIDHALAPLKSLEARCYAGSESGRSARLAVLDFSLEVAASGSVKAVPTFAEPEEPALLECLRQALDRLVFPARGRDRLQLHLELGRAAAEKSGAAPAPPL
jgi:hypothetical protein